MLQGAFAFFVAALLFTITPGPDSIYVISRTIGQGRFAGLVSSWGVCSGLTVHVMVAALGFSVIIQSSPMAFSALKYLGAAYLFWMGVNSFQLKTIKINDGASGKNLDKIKSIYLQGVLVDVLNPKVVLFFLAFFPQFVPLDSPNRIAIFIGLGFIIMLMGLLWQTALVFFSDFFVSRVLRNFRVLNLVNYSLGLVFIALAINLFFYEI